MQATPDTAHDAGASGDEQEVAVGHADGEASPTVGGVVERGDSDADGPRATRDDEAKGWRLPLPEQKGSTMRFTPLLAEAALVLAACGEDGSSSDTMTTGANEPLATEPAGTEPAATEPAGTEPAATEPAATEPAGTEPAGTEPAATESPSMTSATDGVECVPVRIETGSATIEGERCDPVRSPDASFPAALVLNGCGGYESDADLTIATVRALAERGVVGMRVDWLGAEPAPPDTYCEAGAVVGAVNALLRAVVDAVAYLRADPRIDPDRVGTAAYSLGAIAVMAAELGGAGLTEIAPLELRAAALVSYPNQLPTIADLAAERGAPPLLLMTGSEDATAPPRDSRTLAMAAREGGSVAEVVIVEGQDHPWRGDAAVRAGDVLADFLAATLAAT